MSEMRSGSTESLQNTQHFNIKPRESKTLSLLCSSKGLMCDLGWYPLAPSNRFLDFSDENTCDSHPSGTNRASHNTSALLTCKILINLNKFHKQISLCIWTYNRQFHTAQNAQDKMQISPFLASERESWWLRSPRVSNEMEIKRRFSFMVRLIEGFVFSDSELSLW